MDLTGLGSAFDFAKGIMDRFWPKQASEAEKLAAVSQLAPLIQERENSMVEAQKSIIVAEMNQGDNYTKRARPTVVYAGLAFIFLVNVLLPVIINLLSVFKVGHLTADQLTQLKGLQAITLPDAFWWSWTSVCGIWAIGRSAEKRGVTNDLISLITGNKAK